MHSRITSVGLSLLLLGFAPALAAQHSKAAERLGQIGRRNLTKGDLNLYSQQQGFEIGREMARRIEELTTPLDDPPTRAYMQALADRIVRHSDAKIPVQVRIIFSNQVSAFALPGGYLFVTTGMILQTRTEAELAGVLAAEVAHVADRDATRQMTQKAVMRWASLPLLYLGGPAGFALRGTVAIAGPLGAMEFSRHAEERADFLGLQYLYQSGYDPEGYVDFLERVRRLQKSPQGRIARAFSPHVLRKDRVVAAQREIQKDLPARPEYVVTTSSYEHMRNRLEQIMRDQMTFISAPVPKGAALKKGFAGKKSRSEARQ